MSYVFCILFGMTAGFIISAIMVRAIQAPPIISEPKPKTKSDKTIGNDADWWKRGEESPFGEPWR